MKSLFRLAVVISCGLLIGAATAGASTLIGSTVTGTLYVPNLSTILGGPTTATVGASTPTFPNGSIVGNTAFQINITSDQIVYEPFANVTYGIEVFNGFVFDFTDAPTILGVTLDSASTFVPTALSFTADSVSLNLSGNNVNTNSLAILDVQLQASATPEPATWTLLVSSFGLVGIAWMGRKYLSPNH
jgi:hypothetical protein